MTNLIKIEGLRYSVYQGKEKLMAFETREPLETAQINELQKHPVDVLAYWFPQEPESA